MNSLRVSDIRQFAFCPRVVWHRVLMGQATKETPKMAMGRDAEAALARLERRRGLKRYGLEHATRRFAVALESRRLGLHGVCDLVLDVPGRTEPWLSIAGRPIEGLKTIDRRLPPKSYPVEVKTTRGGVGRHHVLQLTAYAMLLEEATNAVVNEAFVVLLPEDRVHVVQTGHGERAEVQKVVGEIRSMMDAQRFPPATRHRSFCPDCEYVNFCGDVL
jgi:CRISPR-associated exonuclease Cas4